MDRTWQSAEYDSWFVPYHQEVLRAHQSHFCLRVIAEDGGFQSDVSDIQTETEQICQAELSTVTGNLCRWKSMVHNTYKCNKCNK